MKSSKVYSADVKPSSTQTTSLFPIRKRSQRSRTNMFKKTFAESLMKSRTAYEEKLHASRMGLDEILLERKSSNSRWYLLFAILGPLATFLMDYAAFVLWPMKNAFTHPDTW